MPFLRVPHDYKERQVLVNDEEERLLHKSLVHFSLKDYAHNGIYWHRIGVISIETGQQNRNFCSRQKRIIEEPKSTKHTEEIVVLCNLGVESWSAKILAFNRNGSRRVSMS